LTYKKKEFEASEVSPMKGVVQFGKPLEVIERVGLVTHRVALPLNLAGVHDVFHTLLKNVYDHLHVVNYILLLIQESLTYEEVLVQVLDYKEQEL
jgi:hypothetical protein